MGQANPGQRSPFDLTGRSALVTGSGSGIGAAVAERICARGGKAEGVALDVRDRAAAEAQAEAEIRKYFGEAQGPAQIADWMNKVADWQAREGVASNQVVFTEFGAMKETIDGVEIGRDSRARWLRDTTAAIASHGWGWTAYVLRDDPFGLYVHEGDRNPDPELMRALHLNDPLSSPAE